MVQSITKAMVMAAGYGKRMRPLTDNLPKPLIEVAGKLLIDHVLDRLSEAGVQTTVVNVHYKAELVRAHMVTRREPKIIISDETDELLETGGGVKKALSELGPDPFLVCNSDAFWIEEGVSNMDRLIATWDDEKMDALILVAPVDRTVGFTGRGDFHLDEAGRLSRRGLDEDAPLMMAGVHIMAPRLLEGAPEGPFSTNILWDKAAAQGRLYGCRLDGLWLHASSYSDLQEIEDTVANL